VQRSNSPDASAILTGSPVHLCGDIIGNKFGVFDPQTVHVCEVQGAVGACGEAGGSKPGVGRCEKIGGFACARGVEASAVRRDDGASDEVPNRLADED